MTLKLESIEYIKSFLKQHTGIVLKDEAHYLIEARLLPVVALARLSSIDHLIEQIDANPYSPLKQKIIDSMTTNETYFFRDIHPFETMKDLIIPDIMVRRSKDKNIRIWCGAAASGQEPYSLVLLLNEYFPSLSSWQVEFIATDISQEMIKRCQEGIYSSTEVNRGIKPDLLNRYFDRIGQDWQIKDILRNKINFRTMNVAEFWPFTEKIDLILLRNILIYFDAETKQKILKRAYDILRPGGYLFLGGSESMIGLNDDFERVITNSLQYYRKGC